MKFYSEKTKQLYDNTLDLEKAELALSKEEEEKLTAKKERAAAAKEVEEAFKAASEANDKAQAMLSEFCKKYGSFHKTYTGKDIESINPFLDWFNLFW